MLTAEEKELIVLALQMRKNSISDKWYTKINEVSKQDEFVLSAIDKLIHKILNDM